ncbi:MAG: hypothetical protein U9Q21_00205 [Candidatus Auribacterota bacterium]|nr:hypothetical protein [Candidatus Auribacterota bacterium]
MKTLSPQSKSKRSPVIYKVNPTSILTLIMLVSLSVLFSITAPKSTKKNVKNPVTWECVLCNYIEEDSIGPPKLCPKCKKRTLYPTATFKCLDCGITFEGYKTIIFYDRGGELSLWELLLPSGEIIDPRDPKVNFQNRMSCPSCGSAKVKPKKFLEGS